MMPQLLVVCTGNTCRSPAAAALLREKGGCQVSSAGLSAEEGRPMTPLAVELLAEMTGLVAGDHRSKSIAAGMVDAADVILCMTHAHRALLLERFPAAAGKLFLLSQLDQNRQIDIQDPYGRGRDAYEAMLRELIRFIDGGMEQLWGWLGDRGD